MGAITNDWLAPLEEEFKKPYYKKLYEKVKEEYQTHEVFPDSNDIFNAFEFTPLSEVKVVILGQDPYHDVGQAHGLCFSVKPDVKIPPSLVNIYQELRDDLGCTIPNNGYLVKWAKQGVMLLNTVLTVRAHYFVGTSSAEKESHVKQSQAFDSGIAPSQPAVCQRGIFWEPSFQQDQ